MIPRFEDLIKFNILSLKDDFKNSFSIFKIDSFLLASNLKYTLYISLIIFRSEGENPLRLRPKLLTPLYANGESAPRIKGG